MDTKAQPNKITTLARAVHTFVQDGESVALGLCLESLIPFAAGHEIIRQGKKDLTLVGPISDILFDQLIGAGCVKEVIAAWVGNVGAGLGHNFRRAIEVGVPRQVSMQDHSNFTLALALKAAALGVPFLPTRTAGGSDIVKNEAAFRPLPIPLAWSNSPRLKRWCRTLPSSTFSGLTLLAMPTCGETWGWQSRRRMRQSG